jgi:opacity protein-like surface antigen
LPSFLLVLLLTAAPAAAQLSTTRGLTLGLHLSGASLVVEGEDRNEGGGLGLRVGYGLSRIVTLFLQVDGAQVEVPSSDALQGEWSMGHVELGARFHFASTLRRWVPYLQAALAGRVVGVEDAVLNEEPVEDVSFNGGGFSVGGGLSFYLRETLALDLHLMWTGGEFTEIEVGNQSVSGLDIDAQSTRLNLGLAWWP